MAELFDIRGKTVLIAGGARGLGAALAEWLAAQGAAIVIGDMLTDEAAEVMERLPGGGHATCPLDVTSEASVDAAVAFARDRAGRLDAVINSAGIARFAPAIAQPLEDFERSVAVNLTGAFLLSRSAARVMIPQGGGRIVHLASVSSRVSNPNYAAYSSSKAGLSQLVKVLAVEWSRQAVNVNAIGPAVTRTPLSEAALLSDPAMSERALAQIPMGRFGEPGDLLGTALLLLSPAGGFITGQTIFVDGGRTLN